MIPLKRCLPRRRGWTTILFAILIVYFIFALTSGHLTWLQLPVTNSSATPNQMSRRNTPVNYDVHIFYYAWYANKETDGSWLHWNHEYMPPWDHNDKKVYPTGRHDPDVDDIGANFFPEIGAYSSRNDKVIELHMQQIRQSGAGVVVVSWYPPNSADEHGKPVDSLIPKLLDAADREGLKICLHVEPYEGRSPDTLRDNLAYVADTHAKHPAFYKRRKGTKALPVYYIYDSYRTRSKDWQRLFSTTGDISVRGTELDGIFLGLFVEAKHRSEIQQAKFDGFYTYFAANGFAYGSSFKSWGVMSKFARSNSLLFVPSVGPGYIDTRVRPWNGVTTRHRRNGDYYNFSWKNAIHANPSFVSITSFNEWHEGTQIEPAIPKSIDGFSYLSYEPHSPNFYLDLTLNWTKTLADFKKGLPIKKLSDTVESVNNSQEKALEFESK